MIPPISKGLHFDISGFPCLSGYLAQATKLGILKNININARDKAIRGNIFALAYNAMNAPLLTNAGNDIYEIDKNTMLMTERLDRLDSYWMTGVVSAFERQYVLKSTYSL